MILQSIRRRDVLKPWLRFRSAETGQWVSRVYALLNPKTTVSIDTRHWRN